MLMTGGWCKWHCFNHIHLLRLLVVGSEPSEELNEPRAACGLPDKCQESWECWPLDGSAMGVSIVMHQQLDGLFHGKSENTMDDWMGYTHDYGNLQMKP